MSERLEKARHRLTEQAHGFGENYLAARAELESAVRAEALEEAALVSHRVCGEHYDDPSGDVPDGTPRKDCPGCEALRSLAREEGRSER